MRWRHLVATTAVLWQLYMTNLNYILVHSFLKIKFNMHLCTFTATVITVYKHDKQKTIVY